MDDLGQLCVQRICDKRGEEMIVGPEYKRSHSLSSIKLDASSDCGTVWVTREKINSGFLTFDAHAEDGIIKTCQHHCSPIEAYTLAKVNNHPQGDGELKVSTGFYPLMYKMIKEKKDWGSDLYFQGCASFDVGVLEWTEIFLRDFEKVLDQAGIYGAVAVSRYPYDYCLNVWKAFCELWGPLANTLHQGNGEMSISLYDLKAIGGLPICGFPYEEFIPPNENLSHASDYPSTVIELLRIHSKLCIFHKQNQVSWSQWLRHFYRGPLTYAAFCESDQVTRKQCEGFFCEKLPLVVSAEGSLAAFLAFWLSRFVLPSGSRRIRAETFSMACLMAQGICVSLAPTTLSYIYHGLGFAVTHSKGPGLSNATFPIHYVVGWLGEHFPCLYRPWADNEFPECYPRLMRYAGIPPKSFDITEARIIFRVGSSVNYRPSSFGISENRFLVDDGSLSEDQFEMLVCMRSALLPARIGGYLWLEPYYPNRFARQLGFDQSIPSDELGYNVSRGRECGVEALAKAQAALFKKNTTSVFYIPRSTREGECTWWYCRWWAKSTMPYLASSVSQVYLTLTGRTLKTKRPVFVVKNLREISVGLRKEVLISDVEDILPQTSEDLKNSSLSKKKMKVGKKANSPKRPHSDDDQDTIPKRICHKQSKNVDSIPVDVENLPDVIDVDVSGKKRLAPAVEKVPKRSIVEKKFDVGKKSKSATVKKTETLPGEKVPKVAVGKKSGNLDIGKNPNSTVGKKSESSPVFDTHEVLEKTDNLNVKKQSNKSAASSKTKTLYVPDVRETWEKKLDDLDIKKKSNKPAAILVEKEPDDSKVGERIDSLSDTEHIDYGDSSSTGHPPPLQQAQSTIHEIINSEMNELRRSYMIGEVDNILEKLSKTPAEIFALQAEIMRSLDFLKSMINVLGSGYVEIEWLSKKIDRSLELTCQLSKDGQGSKADVSLFSRHEECLTATNKFKSQLTDAFKELEELKMTESDVKAAEERAQLLRE